MGTVSKILSGTAILIGMFLVLSRAKESTTIINSLGGVYTNSIKTLQGRS